MAEIEKNEGDLEKVYSHSYICRKGLLHLRSSKRKRSLWFRCACTLRGGFQSTFWLVAFPKLPSIHDSSTPYAYNIKSADRDKERVRLSCTFRSLGGITQSDKGETPNYNNQSLAHNT